MILIVSSALTAYCLLVLVLLTGWRLAFVKRETEKPGGNQKISVIVPVRNEENNVLKLLESLARQTYLNFEIIAVDDHSSDSTLEALRQLRTPNLTILPNAGYGKKQAITTGVENATGTLIVTTDADCHFSPQWLRSIDHFFMEEDVFVFGAVRMETSRSFFSVLQSVEFASLIGSAAATAALGFPTMCNGANLVFRKSAFKTVGGYEGNVDIASGDDEFLMRKIKTKFPGSVRFLADENAVVTTRPQPTLCEFFQQRIRWASKWKHNTSFYTVLLAFFILATQLSFITGVSLLVLKPVSYSLLVVVIIKILVEGVFLLLVCRFLRTRFSVPAFLLLQVLYPLYVVAIGVGSNFLSYNWKGRMGTP